MTVLHAFGSNGSGQLGIGHKDDTCMPHQCVLHDRSHEWPTLIKTIVGGGSHTLVLLQSGDLYAAGSNLNGRAGLPSSVESISEFHEVQNPPRGTKVKLCSALWEASVVVTFENEVYTFGNGPKGELGAGEEVVVGCHKLLQFCPSGAEIVYLASGLGHTVAVLSTGEVYGWGNGRKGQLGEPSKILWAPRKVENLDFKVVRVACGKEFTYLVGSSTEGRHKVIGSDKWNVKSGAVSCVPRWKNLGATWNSILVLEESGKIKGWGREDHGQLGPEYIPDTFENLAVGSEHVLALTESGGVTAWGWGEHGNCGLEIDKRGDVKGRYNYISRNGFEGGARVLGVAAGCATSLVWTGGMW
ncbi:MAG: hypothetical protein LQ342_003545 [Letrouitia transgressa]|nr:MAG: hypothetical protein LQ342_003545 [Letrouitia transgressa]